jgi:predicted nucleic acid-binding protein
LTLVVDASVVVATLTDRSTAGRWAAEVLNAADRGVAAPHLLPVEVASLLRRSELAGLVSGDAASLAHSELLELAVSLHPHAPYAERAWELRANVTAYDACYIALAEALGAPLATLDARLTRAAGPRCEFLIPP